MAQNNINIRFQSSMDISEVRKAISEIRQGLSNLKLPSTLNTEITNTIRELNKEITSFEEKISKNLTSMKDVRGVTSSFEKITTYYERLVAYGERLSGQDFKNFFPDTVTRNIQKASDALKAYNAQIEETNKSIAKQNSEIEKQQKNLEKPTRQRDALLATNITLGQQKGNLTNQINSVTKSLQELYDKQRQFIKGSTEYKELDGQIKTLQSSLNRLKRQYDDVSEKINKNKAEISGYNSEIENIENTITSLRSNIEKLEFSKTNESLNKLRQNIAEIKNVDISEIPNDFDNLNTVINNLTADEIERIKINLDNVKTSAEKATPVLDKMEKEVESMASGAEETARISREMDNLTNQVEAFFGISNTINLFQRAIHQAFESVKELDAAMTETAVVTDFRVEDMWDALPRYTDAANELGTTTLGAYETMTLFYQQGLETNEVFEIGTETMKMARIAGMDYATATDYMTAALRGFNMELNETSAQRINDVYSELAAITAADTEEIASAMTRTASIADSAGVSFEVTSAFLSQMIETTREAPKIFGHM